MMISYAWMISLVLSSLCCAKSLYSSGFLKSYPGHLCAVFSHVVWHDFSHILLHTSEQWSLCTFCNGNAVTQCHF